MTVSRDFERLVALIESALAPAGAVVKSPDHIPDIFTGEQREVDASIRCKIGSVELLIVVECRDRARTEDVTWIEQLATKQKHVGAAHTVAVSSTGFSEPALAAARVHGISTRTIRDITDDDIRSWADKLEVDEVATTCTLGQMALTYYDSCQGTPQLDAPSVEKWSTQGWDAPIFHDAVTGARLSLVDLVSRASTPIGVARVKSDAVRMTLPPKSAALITADPLGALLRDLPRDAGSTETTHTLQFDPGEVAVDTTEGRLTLRRLGFEVRTVSERKRIPAARLLRYAGQNQAIADVAEHQGQQFILTQYRPHSPADDRSGSD